MRLFRGEEALYLVNLAELAPVTGVFGQWYAGTPPYQHRGVDIAFRYREPVPYPVGGVLVPFTNSETVFDGRVVRSFGNAVCIDHESGEFRYTLLAHFDVQFGNLGDTVRAGEIAGLAGETGVARGVHVHWQRSRSTAFPVDIRESVDPLRFIATVEEKMDTFRLLLARAADGPFAEMERTYRFLRDHRGGFFEDWIRGDGEPGPFDGQDDGWDANARRNALRWLAWGGRAREACEALGWTE